MSNATPWWEEFDRLWVAVKRDVLAQVETFMGLRDIDANRGARLIANLERLRDLDPAVRLVIEHGFLQLDGLVFHVMHPDATPMPTDDEIAAARDSLPRLLAEVQP